MIFILKKLNHIHLIRQNVKRLSRLFLKLHSEAKNENKRLFRRVLPVNIKNISLRFFICLRYI